MAASSARVSVLIAGICAGTAFNAADFDEGRDVHAVCQRVVYGDERIVRNGAGCRGHRHVFFAVWPERHPAADPASPPDGSGG